MRSVVRGLALSLVVSTAAVAATKDVTTQVFIRCECLTRYQQWLCETFWWALC